MADTEKGVRLTLEAVRKLIKTDEPNVEIHSLEEEPGSGRGDNYTSMLFRVQAKGTKLLKNGKKENWERAIIYKVLPQSKERRDAYKSESLFKNEVAFYTQVWPALQKLQNNDNSVFTGVAKIYIARDDLIAMEDLKERGFKMVDRRSGLNFENLKLVLKALAGFHALSLTLRETRPEKFKELTNPNNNDAIRETLFNMENEDWYRQYYSVAANNAIRMVSESLPAEMEYRREEILDKLKSFLNFDGGFRTMCELTSEQGPLTVFCHGDCWTNNFLFRDQEVSDTEAVYLVDFQLMRVGSLALDLANLLYCCTSGEVRQLHMTQLLRYYHRHLISSLYKLNSDQMHKDPNAIWELLLEEMRRCGRFGLGMALDMLPIITCASDEAPDLYEREESDREERRAPPQGGVECARLMTDLVIELVDNQVL